MLWLIYRPKETLARLLPSAAPPMLLTSRCGVELVPHIALVNLVATLYRALLRLFQGAIKAQLGLNQNAVKALLRLY